MRLTSTIIKFLSRVSVCEGGGWGGVGGYMYNNLTLNNILTAQNRIEYMSIFLV